MAAYIFKKPNKPKKRRKRVHAKTKISFNKHSKLYTKKYRGQG